MHKCGEVVYNQWLRVWDNYPTYTHLSNVCYMPVRKGSLFSAKCTQIALQSSAFFTQLFEHITSVIHQFMHIVHRAYKYRGKIKKGISI